MSDLICPVDGVRYHSEGILGRTCPCCYGRELIANNKVLEFLEEDRKNTKNINKNMEGVIK